MLSLPPYNPSRGASWAWWDKVGKNKQEVCGATMHEG